jgi:hypothetical protein
MKETKNTDNGLIEEKLTNYITARNVIYLFYQEMLRRKGNGFSKSGQSII